MNKRLLYKIIAASLLIVNGVSLSSAQIRKDPRSLGMGGAYTTIARDFFSVGVNPANLALVRNYIAMQVVQVNLGISNSSLNLTEYNKFNGADLEKDNKKAELLLLIPDEGLTFYFDSSVQPVLGNISWNNMAVTTDIYTVGDLTVPKAPFEVMFYGNEIGRDYSLEAGGEFLGAAEIGFSNGGVYKNYLVGYTVRAIRGLGYFSVISSEANLLTDSSKIAGKGEYLARSSSGGWGLSVDIGLLKINMAGWHFGMAINNLFGKIRWSVNNEEIRYFYNVDDLNLNRVAKKGYSALVEGDNERTKLEEDFSVGLPLIFRLGASRSLSNLLFAIDYQQGFSDRIYASKVAKFSAGIEYYGESRMPVRIGISAGGREGKELGVGFGMRLMKFQFDFGYAFRGAFTPQNSNGFEISLSLWTALGY